MDAAQARPEFSVGGILREWGGEYRRTHAVSTAEARVMEALAACRTAALGGHLEECEECGYGRPVYPAGQQDGNRHCPVCQGKLARRWLKRQMADLLPVPYFHVVFTVPAALEVLVSGNRRLFHGLLFKAVSQALRRLAELHLDGEPGVVAVLHTWGQTLWLHSHVHCVVTGGALSRDGQRWKSSGEGFLFDVHELSAEFRKRFCRLLRRAPLRFAGESASLAGPGALAALLDAQEARPWVVYCKRPFAGPQQVLEYISRYTHRVAVSNRRLRDVSADGTVRFDYKDYREPDAAGQPKGKSMCLPAMEFIRRFLLHLLPAGFRKIRFYGLLAGKGKAARLEAARRLLGAGPAAAVAAPAAPAAECAEDSGDGPAGPLCPLCGGRMAKRPLPPGGGLSLGAGPAVCASGAGPPEVRHAA
jgi:hypothetical protein